MTIHKKNFKNPLQEAGELEKQVKKWFVTNANTQAKKSEKPNL